MDAVALGCETAMENGKWQATSRPSLRRLSDGAEDAQASFAPGQRVWKRQPEGGAIGEGISPRSAMRGGCRPGSVRGTALNSAAV
ncbi:hypothetical protein D9M68_452480 [compost metagenome]